MTVQVDARDGVVRVDFLADLAAAREVSDAVLTLDGAVVIDMLAAREVDDSVLVWLVTTLRAAGRKFTFRGLGWPHADVLRYLEEK